MTYKPEMILHGVVQGPERPIKELEAGYGQAGCCKRPTTSHVWGSPELLLMLSEGLKLLGLALLDLLGLPGSSLSSFDAGLQPCQRHLTSLRLQVQRKRLSQPTTA